jgi:hypothetical protein
MGTATSFTPAEIRERVSALDAQFEEARRQKEEAERRCRVIEQKIDVLQGQCPHENTTECPVLDGVDVKFRTFCKDCEAQL